MTRPIPLVISVDTEEDNWTPVHRGASVENLRELPRFAAFCGRHGIRATFFTTYQVAACSWAADLLRDVTADVGEIGTHLHPWNTPPSDGGGGEPGTMLKNFPVALQRAKIEQLGNVITEAFGRRPTTFRAGRFGLGPETVRVLAEAGYEVDSSVTPFISWERFDNGPSFVGAPLEVYRLGDGDFRHPDPTGKLVEVPLSVGYTRFSSRRWRKVARLLGTASAQATHLAGIAARSGFMRRAILSPETNSVRDMLALSRGLLEGDVGHLHLFFHSSSLRPGLTPFTRSRVEVDRLYGRIEDYLAGLSGMTELRFHTVGEVAATLGGGGAAPVTSPDAARERLRVTVTAAASPRPPCVVIVNYHYPPDGSVGGLRWAALAKYLVRLGWEVHVVTAATVAGAGLHDGVQVHVCPRRRTLNDLYRLVISRARGLRRVASVPGEYSSHVRPGPVRALRREIASLLSFPDESRGWMLAAAWHTRRLVRRFRPDVVVTSGPPHSAHLAGLLAVLGKGTPLVADLRDPWSTRLGAWRDDPVFGTRIARFLIPRLEQWLFRRVREVVANTQELAATTTRRYPSLRVTWVRNGVDLEGLPAITEPPFPGFGIAYAGTLYGGRTLAPVLEAFAVFLREHPDAAAAGARLRVAGHMVPEQRARLERNIHRLGLELYVEVLGVVSRPAALSLVARSRVAIVLAQDQELQVPAKLYETLALRVPTLVIAEADSATAREARRLGAVALEPTDIAGITRTLAGWWTGARVPGTRVPETFDYTSLAATVADLLAEGTRLEPLREPEPAHAGEPQANWTWLAEPSGWDRALELTLGTPVPRASLTSRFARVDTWAGAPLENLAIGAFALPFEAAAFDAVAIRDAWAERPVRSRLSGLQLPVLRECARVLKSGGCLCLATDNARWYRRLLQRGPSPSRRAIERLLRRAGFGGVHAFYTTPSIDFPRSIIPAARRTVGRYETEAFAPSARAVVRRGLAAAGLHDVLHPSLLFTAYR